MTQSKNSSRLLVVEDDLSIANLHREYFTRHGFEVVLCSDGQVGLSTFKKDPYAFDLIITDLQMPGLNGISLCEAVLALRPNMPVIVVSGFGDAGIRLYLEQLGVYKIMTKPVPMSEILKDVRSAVSCHGFGHGNAPKISSKLMG